jgi:hypothetical protein
MTPTLSFDRLRSIPVATGTQLPDFRTRPNRIYELVDVALAAFVVFFIQSPSLRRFVMAARTRWKREKREQQRAQELRLTPGT